MKILEQLQLTLPFQDENLYNLWTLGKVLHNKKNSFVEYGEINYVILKHNDY